MKPSFFKNELLAEVSFEWRILFAGLWGLADRAGRLEERPKRIKMEVFPGDDVNVAEGLTRLEAVGLISRYTADTGQRIIAIPCWQKHVKPWGDEPESTLPGPRGNGSTTIAVNPTLAFDDLDDEGKPPKKAPFQNPEGGLCTLTSGTSVPSTSSRLTEPPDLPPGKEPPPGDPPSPPRASAREDAGPRSTLMSRFELFWQAYPRRQGRGAAVRSWERLKPTDALLARMLAAIEQQRQSPDWLRENGQFIPNPEKWLDHQRWLDEGVDVSTPTVSATTRANLANAAAAKAYLRSR